MQDFGNIFVFIFFIPFLFVILLFVMNLQIRVRLKRVEFALRNLIIANESGLQKTTSTLKQVNNLPVLSPPPSLIPASSVTEKNSNVLDSFKITPEYLKYNLPFWIGAIALMIGFCFLMLTRGLLPEFIKIASTGAIGGAMVYYGISLGKTSRGLAEGFQAAGIGVLFAAIFAIENISSSSLSALFLSLIVSFIGLHLGKKGGPLVAWVGLIGGMFAPVFLISHYPQTNILFLYLIPIVLASFSIASYAKCNWIFLVSIGASFFWLMIWKAVPSMHHFTTVPILFSFLIAFLSAHAHKSAPSPFAHKNITWLTIGIIPLIFAILGISFRIINPVSFYQPYVVMLSWFALCIGLIGWSDREKEKIAIYMAYVASFLSVYHMQFENQLLQLMGLTAIWMILPQIWWKESKDCPKLFKEHPVMSALMGIVLASVFCSRINMWDNAYRLEYVLAALICFWFAILEKAQQSQSTVDFKNWLIGAWAFTAMFCLQTANANGALIMNALMLFAWTSMFARNYNALEDKKNNKFIGESIILIVPTIILLRLMPHPAAHIIALLALLGLVIVSSRLLKNQASSLAAAGIGFMALILSVPGKEWLPQPGQGPIFGFGLPISTICVCAVLFLAVKVMENSHNEQGYHRILERISALALVVSAWCTARWLVSPLHYTISPYLVQHKSKSVIIVPQDNWDGWSAAASMIALGLSGLFLIKSKYCMRWPGMNSVGKAAWKASEIWAIFAIGIMFNPLITQTHVGTWPVFNALPLMYLLPAIIFFWKEMKPNALPELVCNIWMGGVFGLLFITTEVHQIFSAITFQGTQAEFYTYSLAWLIYGACLLWIGNVYNRIDIQKIAFAALGLAVFKVFLLDTFSLGGIWRILSFIGLGLAFMLLGNLYSKIKKETNVMN